VGREPVVGQEVGKLLGAMGRQTLEDILDVGKRIDMVTLAVTYQPVQDRSRLAQPFDERAESRLAMITMTIGVVP
jgi:hypothetical protein